MTKDKLNKKEWLTMDEAVELTGKHYMTIYSWVKKGLIEYEQITKRSPIMINRLSLPAYLRK
jgi:excisionase family DNA binding protein